MSVSLAQDQVRSRIIGREPAADIQNILLVRSINISRVIEVSLIQDVVGLCDNIEEDEDNIVLVNIERDLTREQVVERILQQTDQYWSDKNKQKS